MLFPRPFALAALLLAPPAALADVIYPGPRAPNAGGPVAVYRGARADASSTVPAPVEEAPVPVGPELLAAGNRLWIVDRDAGTLTACRLEPTARVGRDRVRCAARELPGDD